MNKLWLYDLESVWKKKLGLVGFEGKLFGTFHGILRNKQSSSLLHILEFLNTFVEIFVYRSERFR
jgi:hypothetical protein